MWIQSLIVAACIWIAAIVVAISIGVQKYKSRRILTPTNTMLVGTFLSSVVIFLPIYSQKFAESAGWTSVWKTVLISLHHAIRLFVIDSDFDEVHNALIGADEVMSAFYSSFAAILYICAPILTFGFILSFFRNISSYRRLIASYFRDTYIFSELNEKSIALASSILEHHKAAIVFTDVFEQNDEGSYEMTERARELGAICFKKDILSVNFRIHSRKSQVAFFVNSEDEAENLKHALGITDGYRNRKNTVLYVFSTAVDSELLLTSANKGELKVRMVNDVRSLVYRNLYDNGNVLFETAAETDSDEKQIGAAVIGTGAHGNEMIKALSWFCQMDGYRVSIDAFDKDPLARSKFTACCPELMSDKYNGVYVEGEAKYFIDIHSGVDVDTFEFFEEIKNLPLITYVFVSLGSDEANVRCAVNLRVIFEQMGIHPVIHAIVYSSDKKKALTGIKNYRGQDYDIDFIGDIENLYSEEIIINSELEQDALRRHLSYDKSAEETFWDYEYNYRSSMAAAIHAKVRVAFGIPGATKTDYDLTDEERAVIAPLEHRRWNAYMRSEGYVYSGSPDKKSRNDLGKMHHDLVDFASLPEEEKRKDSRVGSMQNEQRRL